MIVCKLAEIMANHKERNIADLARRTGLNRATVKSMFDDTFQKIDRNAINAICNEYGIRPGDLLEYIPDKEGEGSANAKA
ncbi:helix-turn-helix domain-containing protein [Desulfoscipio gibsoniae]|uniref:Putative transcriptional regulator n=1 Tax=Desulfoscipio gibsoniae DSM 7213 TaxID=767817 RepID=R4KK09_9FIRM|nr:helix-turn-helix transcriptional regulator [Desulfoscipio gibsoniae]AGL02974.1 putative transcriptional regulator [Desulfoscipio gibsoniae DSM 7213]